MRIADKAACADKLLPALATSPVPARCALLRVLGVVGTVRQLLEGAAAYARGDNKLLASVFNLSSVQFGNSIWLPTTRALDAAFATMREA